MNRIGNLKSSKLTLVLMQPITSAYVTDSFSLISRASLVMTFEAEGPATPVVAKKRVKGAISDIDDLLFLFFCQS